VTADDPRCAHCRGPVHTDEHEVRCILCGVTETFIPSERGYRLCSAGCELGWDEARHATCRACGGTGLEVAS
jgi:hypothetical protein